MDTLKKSRPATREQAQARTTNLWRIITILDGHYGGFDRVILSKLSGERSVTFPDRYIAALVAEGVIRPVRSRGATQSYTIVNRGDAPPPRAAGRSGASQPRLWTALRNLKSARPDELALAASIEGHSVDCGLATNYLLDLVRAGYVVQVGGGRSGDGAKYRLLPARNTGPRAPIPMHDGVAFDLNRMRRMAGRPA